MSNSIQNRADLVGSKVITSESGIGEIVELTCLHDGGELFYKVIFDKNKCINYFSVENNSAYRVISSESVIKRAIDLFKTKFETINYTTVQEYINEQKQALKCSDICKLAVTLSNLNNEADIHPQVNKYFKSAMKSFLEEVKYVLNLSELEAQNLLCISA